MVIDSSQASVSTALTQKEIVLFGRHQQLVGVLEQSNHMLQTLTHRVILLGAGLVHRAGPFGLNIELARCLGSRGFTSLRFDFSGIGDSAWPNDSDLSFNEQHIEDMQAALDYLDEKLGVQNTLQNTTQEASIKTPVKTPVKTHKTIIVGSCTGADNAFKISALDDRVDAVVMLDGYAFPTPTFNKMRLLPFIKSPWKLFISLYGRIQNLIANMGDEHLIEDAYNWVLPEKKSVERDLKAMLARNVNLNFIFSGGAYTYFRYEAQIYDAFPNLDWGDQLSVKIFPEADHLYVCHAHRQAVIQYIGDWCEKIGRELNLNTI